jgi:ABC-type sugar transport system ATPase subunit
MRLEGRMELHIHGVSKTYANGVQALKDVTLTVPARMYGLLGSNGATLQEPDTGTHHPRRDQCRRIKADGCPLKRTWPRRAHDATVPCSRCSSDAGCGVASSSR